MKIKVLVYWIGQLGAVEEIDDALPAFQAIVGGFIECVPLTHRLMLVCNEEGKLNGMRPNRYVSGVDMIHGDFFITATEGPGFASLTDVEIADVRAHLEVDEARPRSPVVPAALSSRCKRCGHAGPFLLRCPRCGALGANVN